MNIKIPLPLSPEAEERQANKKREKRAARKKKEREKKRNKQVEEKQSDEFCTKEKNKVRKIKIRYSLSV